MAIDFEHRVRCQQPGCGHSVHAAVHIVEESSHLLVGGSTCFAKRYGSAGTLGAAQYGGDLGRKLTDKERILLAENTQMLLAHFEAQETVAMANIVQAIKLLQRCGFRGPKVGRWPDVLKSPPRRGA